MTSLPAAPLKNVSSVLCALQLLGSFPLSPAVKNLRLALVLGLEWTDFHLQLRLTSYSSLLLL